jgi:pimeloyl-ACP methyl ester carboxylesterase
VPPSNEDPDVRADAPAPQREGLALGLSTAGFHRIAYADWGPEADTIPVVCLHGLTRQGRDFDFLAARLARHGRRVVCPDLPGRGRSARLATPFQYVFPQHCSDAMAVIRATGSRRVDWVGTSIGGLIGMVLAALPGTPIRRLVINDIGPSVPPAAALRTGQKLTAMPRHFPTFEDAVAYFRATFTGYGRLSDEQWAHIARHSVEWSERDANYRMLLDPNIVHAFHMFLYQAMTLWEYWRNVHVPTLLLVGEQSDFLPSTMVEDMLAQNPRARSATLRDVGHTPMLMSDEQIAPVLSFLLEA